MEATPAPICKRWILRSERESASDGQRRGDELPDYRSEGDVAVVDIKRCLGLVDAAAARRQERPAAPARRPAGRPPWAQKTAVSCPGRGDDPSVSTWIQLIATRKQTTSRPEMTPMKIERTRKSRSSRLGANLCTSAGFGLYRLSSATVTGSIPGPPGTGSTPRFCGRAHSSSTWFGTWAILNSRASSPAGVPQTCWVTISVS